MRLDARKIGLPAKVLAVDLAKIAHKERILISRITRFIVNTLHALAESIANQTFCCKSAILMVVEKRLFSDMGISLVVIRKCNRIKVIDDSCCHNHIPRL